MKLSILSRLKNTHSARTGETFRIVFWGELRPGSERDQVVEAFMSILKMANRPRILRMFSGYPVVLGENLSLSRAHRMIGQLRDAGAVCRLESEREVVPGQSSYLQQDFGAAVLP
ncbi:hypothetical protein ACXYTJ_11440 [Gilvimarinus sp. F26214L]|uniref:hypothetical protein n=1 Tax=Gilvimarinus sp. DZF01 TaxID=3461371 RepID=UPI004045FC3F